MKSVLVTGATGFIGRHLCAALADRGVAMTAVGRSPQEGPWTTWVTYDFASGQEFPAGALTGIDTVFHLASKAHAVSEVPGEDSGYTPIIVDGTRRLLDAMAASGLGRIIYLSSVKAMGDAGFRQPQSAPLIGSEPDQKPTTPYGKAKAAAEGLILNSGLPHPVVLRPTMVYGPGQKGNLDRMAEAIRKNRFPPLKDNGNQRSIVHVNNVVSACLTAAENPAAAGKTYLLAEHPPYSTRQLYDRLRAELNLKPICWGLSGSLLLLLAKGGDLGGKLLRRRLPLDTDTVWKLLGSAWYDGSAIEKDLGFCYEGQLPLLGTVD
jgi:UDP-glucose 4-epimerase